MAITEYDAFGPWIYEVTDKHPLPPQFEKQVEEHDYEILIKIPRDIERRKANPDMALYNYVIGCFEEKIYIYQRLESEVTKHIVNIKEVCALRDLHNLLLGEYQLYTADSIISFKYNTVSSDLIKKLTDWIRSKQVFNKEQSSVPSINDEAVASIDDIYSNIYHAMQREEDHLKIIALQEKVKLKYVNHNPIQKIYKSLLNSHLQSGLYLKSSTDIILLQRGFSFTKMGYTDYSNMFTYIPFKHIKNVSVNPSSLTSEVVNIKIEANNHTFDMMLKADNASLKGFENYIEKICSK